MSYSWRNGSFSRAARDYVLEQNRRTQEALLENANKPTADDQPQEKEQEHMDTDVIPYEQPETEIVQVVDEHLPAPVVIPPADFPNLEDAEPGMSLALQYRKFNQAGETVRAVFIGFTTIGSNQQGKGKIPAAVFQSADGVWLNAGDNLVNQVRRLAIHTPVVVTYKGEQKTQSGSNVKTFEVRLLVPKGKANGGPAPAAPVQKPAPAPVKSGSMDIAEAEQAWNDHPSPDTWKAFCAAIGATAAQVNAAFKGGVNTWMSVNKKTSADAARALADYIAF